MYKICKTAESVARQRSVEKALQELMLHRRFDEISVSGLCEAAGIPRNSFYRYFDSREDALYALIDHSLMETNDEAILHWNGDQRLSLSDLEYFFELWYRKRDLLDALERNNCSWLLVDRIGVLMGKGNEKVSSGGNFAQEQAYYILSYAIAAIMLRWHKFGFPATPLEMAQVVFDLFSESNIVMSKWFL